MTRYEYDPAGTAYSDGRRDGAEAERNRIVGLLKSDAASDAIAQFVEVGLPGAACSALAQMITEQGGGE